MKRCIECGQLIDNDYDKENCPECDAPLIIEEMQEECELGGCDCIDHEPSNNFDDDFDPDEEFEDDEDLDEDDEDEDTDDDDFDEDYDDEDDE